MKKSGGKRQGSGAKKKFGDLETEYINILIPTIHKSTIKSEFEKVLRKYLK